MNIFSLILTIFSVIYVFLGFNVIRLDNRSLLNRLFFALNLSLIIWTFSAASYISVNDEAACIFWYKLSSVGCYLFISMALHFFFVFAKKENLLKQWWIYIIIYLPGIILSYKEITSGFYAKAYSLGSNGWIISAQTDSMWFWSSIIFIIVYVSSCIIISYRMQKRATSQRERKQVGVLIITSVLALLTGLVLMVLAVILEVNIPDITPMAVAIWSIGIYYAIVKHKLMAMTPSFIADNLFQTIIDSIILTNSYGLILNVNPETQRLLGYDQRELVGEPMESLFLLDSQSENTNIPELMNTCPVRDMEAFIISKNGVKIPIILSISECRDNYNTRVGFVLVSKDVTEYKRAEEAMQESETKFRTIFESTYDAIFLMDQNIFIDCTPKTLELFGCTKEQIIGQTPYRFSPEVQPDGRNSMEKAQEKINEAMEGQSQFFEWKHHRYDGTLFDAEVSLSIFTVANKIYVQVIVHDITERKKDEEQIKYLATHDGLTGLPNRLMFTQLLNHSIKSARHHKRKLAVFYIDLDRFKIINDTKGHDAGDKLLQEIGMRYKLALRAADVVGRQGGDEFVILIEEFKESSDLEIVANKILSNTLKPIILLGEECRITASIGISIYPKDGEDGQSLMKNADTAMYYAKEEGKNNFQFYSKDIQSISTERLGIETNLRLALEQNEFSLHYQAKVNFKTGMITGVEALLRWQNSCLGSVTPMQFIPVAEETGMIVAIGEWVLKTACKQNVAWQKQGIPAIPMAVNLSLRELTDSNLVDVIKAALNDSGMEPGLLELEITESMMMINPAKMITLLDEIKKIGVRLAIDDFGTGYSSLSQIQNFQIDTLKIDRSFIRNIPENDRDKAIAHAIIAMGETLGLTIVAEGVETVEQMNFLKEHSCNEMQGYFFSKPIEPDKFADLLNEYAPAI